MKNKAITAFLSSSSLRARFGSGFLFSLLATSFNGGSTLLVNIIIANLLGRKAFGEFAIVQNTILTFSSVASLANGFTATKYVAEFRSVDKERTGRILGLCSSLSLAMGSAFTIILFVGAPWLAEVVLKAPYLSTGLMLAAAAVFFNVNNFYQTGVLAGLESYPAIARAGMIGGTMYFILCAGAATIWGLDGALAGLTISGGIQWLALRFFLRRECSQQRIVANYRCMGKEHNIFFTFAVPAALSGFSTMPALWLANTLLVQQSGGYIQMALYAAANNLRVLGLLLPGLLNNVAMSLLNNARGLGETERYRKMFWGNLAVTTGVALAGGTIVVLAGPTFLAFFGRDFGEGYPILLVLMGAMVVEALMLAFYQVVQSQGRIWLSFFLIVLPRDWTIVLLAYVLTPAHGAMGLALAYTIGCGLGLLTTGITAWRISRSGVTGLSRLSDNA